jgi:hypothetical protein
MLPDIPPLAHDARAPTAGDMAGALTLDDFDFLPAVPMATPTFDAGVVASDHTEPGTDGVGPETGETAISREAESPKNDGGERFDTGSDTPPVQNVVRTTVALAHDTPGMPVRTTPEVPVRRVGDTGPGIPRDRDALLLLVRLRLASMKQMAGLAYRSASLVVARRRLRRLREDGWITFWDLPTTRGAAIRYGIPTPRALRWANDVIASTYDDGPAATLMHRMLPVRPRRLSDLQSGKIPDWFPHQNEINMLLIALARAEKERLAWFSSWDCPFPDKLNGLKAPQPDYVLLRPQAVSVAVTFGEHDRATESGPVWPEKLAAYAVAKELAREWLGIESFTVDVTVLDFSSGNPINRLRRLVELAREAGTHTFMRFALAGWLHAFPGEAVWFTGGSMPMSESVCRDDHLEHLRA